MMRTQPLQIVYNPATIKRISDFFKRQVSAKKADLHVIEQQILDTAWARYEELKTQTKTGLYHAMDDLLLGQVKVRQGVLQGFPWGPFFADKFKFRGKLQVV